MRTAAGTDDRREESELGMEPRIIRETDRMVLVGVPLEKQSIADHLAFLAKLVEAAERITKKMPDR